MTKRYFSSMGRIVRLGAPLASGGEGQVLQIPASPHLLAKVYWPSGDISLAARREAKVRAMQALPTWPARDRMAWPIDRLYGLVQGQRQFCGFIMPRMVGTPLLTLTIPALLLRRIPAARDGVQLQLFVHRVVGQLAEGLGQMEGAGVIPCDISAANFLVDPATGKVGSIDCDSYDIPACNGGRFEAGVATPEFLPPELLEANGPVQLTPEHLRFSAAVLFFTLLTHGWHPFQCLGGGSPTENILSGRTAMGSSHGLATGRYPKPVFTIYRSLHPAIKRAFIDTLVRGHRNPASRVGFGEWQRAIQRGTQAIERTPRASAGAQN